MDSSKNRKARNSSLAQEINADPASDDRKGPDQLSRPPGGPRGDGEKPSNIRDTKAWKASKQGVNRVWSNYKTTLATAFKRMTRAEQEALVQRLCVIVTLGVAILGLLLFYPLLPRLGRVFGVPAALFGAYWAGNKIVTPVVLARIEDILNKQ